MPTPVHIIQLPDQPDLHELEDQACSMIANGICGTADRRSTTTQKGSQACSGLILT